MAPESDCSLAAFLSLSSDRDGKQRQMFTQSSHSDHKLAVETEQINEDYCLTVVCLRTIETAPASELLAPSFHSYDALAGVYPVWLYWCMLLFAPHFLWSVTSSISPLLAFTLHCHRSSTEEPDAVTSLGLKYILCFCCTLTLHL